MIRALAATQRSTRVPVVLASAGGGGAPRLPYPCAIARTARRALFRFGDTTRKSATFFAGRTGPE